MEKSFSLKKAVLIFSGYNTRGIVAFCRFLKNREIPFYIITSGSSDLIKRTIYKDNIIFERESNKLTVGNLIKCSQLLFNKKGFNEALILPSTEYLNRFLLKERKVIEELGFQVPLVSSSLYSEISDKYSFSQICKAEGIPTPKEFASLQDIKMPFVAKPVRYFTEGKNVSDKPLLVFTDTILSDLQDKMKDTQFYFQEFIGGSSYYLLYYFNKNQEYSVFSQQNLIQQDNGLSIIAAKSSDYHKKEISKLFAEIFKKRGFRGLVMVEVKEYNGVPYMIEANPRIWGPSQLILDAGMDLFLRFAIDFSLIPYKELTYPTYQPGVRYFWSGGVFDVQKRNKEISFHSYTKENYFDEYSKWVKRDIYLRQDTMELYIYELNK